MAAPPAARFPSTPKPKTPSQIKRAPPRIFPAKAPPKQACNIGFAHHPARVSSNTRSTANVSLPLALDRSAECTTRHDRGSQARTNDTPRPPDRNFAITRRRTMSSDTARMTSKPPDSQSWCSFETPSRGCHPRDRWPTCLNNVKTMPGYTDLFQICKRKQTISSRCLR